MPARDWLGLLRVMRIGGRVWVCAALAGVVAALLAGCSGLGMMEPPPRVISQPPSDQALERSVAAVAGTARWLGVVEASPVRQAHLLSPADWIVCAQSGARDLSPPYAMFFNGDAMVHFRIAVEIDDCRRVPYAPVIVPAVEPMGGPLVLRP